MADFDDEKEDTSSTESDSEAMGGEDDEAQGQEMNDGDEADAEKLEELEKAVLNNLYGYETHIQLIDALRKAGELDKVREARQRFAGLFPLTPILWLKWINDERRIDTPWEEVKLLFEKAVQDYLSVQIWLEYVQAACGNITPAEVRELCERALSHVGLHVADGRLLWDAYRILESSFALTAGAGEDSPASNLLQIFKRQLSIPLMGAEETKQELLDTFGEGVIDPATKQAFNMAAEELRALSVYEIDLRNSATLDAYWRYLDHEEGRSSLPGANEKEKKEKPVQNIGRLQCLYERAITDHCLTVDLWLRYINWLGKRFTSTSLIMDKILPVCERSIRNCAWSSALWTKYALMIERSGMEGWLEKADEILNRATTEGAYSAAADASELWLTWAYQKRRAADAGICSYDAVFEVFGKGADFLKEKFGERYWDTSAVYRRSWALLLMTERKSKTGVSSGRNPENARRLWQDILAQDGNGRLASVWLDYYQFERRFGEQKEIRKALFNALNSVTDFPDYIATTLRQFELEEGTLRDLEEADERIRRQKARLEERKIQQQAFTSSKQQHQGGGRKNQTAQRPPYNDSKSGENFGKRKTFDEPQSSPAKKHRVEKNFTEPKDTFNAKPVEKPIKMENAPAPDFRQETKKAIDLPVAERRRRTVFVSNLDFTLTEDDLKAIFDGFSIGNVIEVRLLKHNSGRSKGFGYVEFDSAESVARALQMDRHPVDGRPMYIQEHKERGGDAATYKMEKAAGVGDKSAAAEKYHFGAGLEKNKLFVKNIPKHAGEGDLRTIFEPYGSLKSLRLVTFPSGQSKGIAYVEYADVEHATNALSGTNGTVLFEKTLDVAYSNPPPRRAPGPFGGPSRFQGRPVQQLSANEGNPSQLMPPPKLLVPRVLGAKGGSKPRLNLE